MSFLQRKILFLQSVVAESWALRSIGRWRPGGQDVEGGVGVNGLGFES